MNYRKDEKVIQGVFGDERKIAREQSEGNAEDWALQTVAEFYESRPSAYESHVNAFLREPGFRELLAWERKDCMQRLAAWLEWVGEENRYILTVCLAKASEDGGMPDINEVAAMAVDAMAPEELDDVPEVQCNSNLLKKMVFLLCVLYGAALREERLILAKRLASMHMAEVMEALAPVAADYAYINHDGPASGEDEEGSTADILARDPYLMGRLGDTLTGSMRRADALEARHDDAGELEEIGYLRGVMDILKILEAESVSKGSSVYAAARGIIRRREEILDRLRS